MSQTAALRQLTGIKKNVAPVLSAELGDLSTYRRTQLVAAVGLNPIPNESGKYAGRSRLSKGGSKRARAMPHLAARSLFRSKGPSRDHIEWLKRRGLSNTPAPWASGCANYFWSPEPSCATAASTPPRNSAPKHRRENLKD